MLSIDGSQGEGGGQILRTSLALSAITNIPFSMYNIRAKRAKPGLMPQHLICVQAASVITNATVTGAETGSMNLKFEPKGLVAGEYRWDIGTAGSTSLVLQTVFIPLSLARNPSWVTITGGTHVPWSPCHHFLELHWLPYMRKIGFQGRLELKEAGFYPQGGGRILAEIQPVGPLTSLNLSNRGQLKIIKGISAVANLDFSVAERQKRQAEKRLSDRGYPHQFQIIQMPSRWKNTMLLLLAEFEYSQCCYYGLGAKGKPAEKVADEAVDSLYQFLDTNGVIDEHLTDQLVLPLALVKDQSIIRTSKISLHLLTNIEIIQKFLSVKIEVEGELDSEGMVRIVGKDG